jgi:hypothetical protein
MVMAQNRVMAVAIGAIKVVLGVAVGFVVSFMLISPTINAFLCKDFWEQGCGEYHNLGLFGALIASVLGGVLAGFGAARLFGLITKRLKLC